MEKILTRSGVISTLQIANMGTVSSTPFKLDVGFQIKNDSDEPVELEVSLMNMGPNEYITTLFDPGWNPEIVREIKSGDVSNIKWGL